MSLSDLCTTFVTSSKLKDESEKNIVEFATAPWGLGMGSIQGIPPLFPVQRFILKCYYNIPLIGGEKDIIIRDRFNEQELYRFNELGYLHFLKEEGRINIDEVTGLSADSRMNLVLVIGRRGTKTTTISVIVAFETYKLLKKIFPQAFYGILPNDEIRVSCIATNQEQATELFGRITGFLEGSEYFKPYRNKPTLSYMQLSTPHDIETFGEGMRPSLRIVASPCSGRGLRGHNNIIAILDEMAYFFEKEVSDDKSDRAIYDAIAPSVASFTNPSTREPHGRVICISSPASRTGKFYELFEYAMTSECKNLLMLKAPTWEVNHMVSPKFLRSEYAEGPSTYMSEYGAEFSDRIATWIENEQILRVNVIPGLKLKKMSYERLPHFLGIDVGLKGDGTAVAICHLMKKECEGILKDYIELDHIEVRYAEQEGKEYFHPEDIAEWISTFTEKFFIVKGMMDPYYGLSMLPVFEKKGIRQIELRPSGRELKSKIWQNLMSKMLDNTLRIPEANEVDGAGKAKDLPLIDELLKLKASVYSQYLIDVYAPEIKGMHDDLSDAFARSVYLATEYLSQVGLSGGGRSTLAGAPATGGINSYRKYMTKQRRSALFTNRPGSGLQMDTLNGRHMTDRMSTLGGGGLNRWR